MINSQVRRRRLGNPLVLAVLLLAGAAFYSRPCSQYQVAVSNDVMVVRDGVNPAIFTCPLKWRCAHGEIARHPDADSIQQVRLKESWELLRRPRLCLRGAGHPRPLQLGRRLAFPDRRWP